jgi:hypothetical protein
LQMQKLFHNQSSCILQVCLCCGSPSLCFNIPSYTSLWDPSKCF